MTYGKIINISSTAGIFGILPLISNYCAAKAGIILLTRCAAKELGPYGINVNAIAPGLIKTSLYIPGRTPEQIAQMEESYCNTAVVGRLGTTEDIAKLAVFLASDDSSFICGETITIDGGMLGGL